ncbi:copper oxidase [Candidatus Poribacteria bacterium]|nr:copper oxidase [Candidatus Poribacteria bacterium]
MRRIIPNKQAVLLFQLPTLLVAALLFATGCGEEQDETDLFVLPESGTIRSTGQTKEFALVAKPSKWLLSSEVVVEAYTYNGQVPGPTIRVTEGDTVKVTVQNRLPEPTSIHWHGLHLPFEQDGAAPLNQKPIQPGEVYTYEFMASHAGTFMYHPHVLGNDAEQIDKGLYGVFIIDPQGATPHFDREYTLLLSGWRKSQEMGMGGQMNNPGDMAVMDYSRWTINGKLYPETEPLQVKKGERVRIRLVNVSNMNHPMHLHGHDVRVIAMDGEPVRNPQRMNTVSVHPGQTLDLELIADNPGVWVFHCHELHHAESGMMTTVVYEGTQPKEVKQDHQNNGGMPMKRR